MLTPWVVQSLANVADLALNASASCVRYTDGTAACLESATHQMRIRSRFEPIPVPVLEPVPVRRVTQVVAGNSSQCVRLEDHHVWCRYLQYPPDLPPNQGSRVRPTLSPWHEVNPAILAVDISAGRPGYLCFVGQDGGGGCVNLGSLQDIARPPRVHGLTDATQAAWSDVASCARARDGSVLCWGRNELNMLGRPPITEAGRSHREDPERVGGLTGVLQIAIGEAGQVCAVTSAGGLSCWGRVRRDSGRNGDGTLPEAVAVTGLQHVAEICAGETHACARLEDGTVRCWGSNAVGQVGDGTLSDRASPTRVSGIAGALQVACATTSSCAVLAGGAVSCWGGFASAAGGDGGDRRPPVGALVGGLSNVTATSGGSYDNWCARRSDGSIWCWGRANRFFSGASAGPTPISGLTEIVGVSSGVDHACALRANRTVMCWGAEDNGRVGSSATGIVPAPVTVQGLAGVAEVHAGAFVSGARTTDGAVWLWGATQNNVPPAQSLHDGPTPQRFAALTGVTSLDLQLWSCAVLRDRSVQCWGRAELEVGGSQVIGPVRSPGLDDAVQVVVAKTLNSLAEPFWCARRSDGTVRCAGSNLHGQLGNGRAATTAEPFAITFE